MPYFPRHKERAYRCQSCGKDFYPGVVSCLVAHAPGTCCHQYEEPAPTPIDQIRNLLKETP